MSSLVERFPLPTLGVSLKFLLESFSTSIPDSSTVHDVSKLVMNNTKGGNPYTRTACSMVELWDADESLNVTGKADYYVIHAWSCKFKEELLETLQNHCSILKVPDIYVYIDCFSLNLHTLQRHLRVYPWWSSTFVSDLKSNFKEVLISWPQWHNPTLLTRTWCLWEIYCCVSADLPFTITLTPSDSRQLTKTLVTNLRELIVNVRDVRLRNSDCGDRRMKKRTLQAVKKQIGFPEFNRQLLEAVEVWWCSRIQKEIFGILESYQSQVQARQISNVLNFMNSYGFLLRSCGNPQVLEISQMIVNFGGSKQNYPQNFPIERARDLNNLSVVLCELDLLEDGVVYAQEATNILREELAKIDVGHAHPDFAAMVTGEAGCLATSLNNLGNLYCQLEDFEKASQSYQESVQLKLNVYGPDHLLVASGLNNLGLAYKLLHKLTDAEGVLRQALQTRVRLLGMDSIEVAQSRHNLAGILEAGDVLQEAKKESKLAYEIALKKFGNDADITNTYQQLLRKIESKLS